MKTKQPPNPAPRASGTTDRTKQTPTRKQNGAKRPSQDRATHTGPVASRAVTSPAAGTGPLTPDTYQPAGGLRLLHYGACAAFALIHAVATTMAAASVDDEIVVLAIMMIPAWVTIALLPGARRTGFVRWLVILTLANTSTLLGGIVVLVVGHTWAMHRFFFVEYPHTSRFAPAWAALAARRTNRTAADRSE